MPTLEALVDGVYRDLADEDKAVFSVLQIEDFVRGGIADLNRVAPTDTTHELTFTTDPETGAITVYEFDVPLSLVYRIELRRNEDGYAYPIPEAVEGQTVSSGFVFRQTATGGHLELPRWFLDQVNPLEYTVRLYGYATRPLPYTVEGESSPEVSISQEEEYSIRLYGKAQGFDLLAHDRSLYQQWQGRTNNTDVSPTQITQMAYNAKRDWDRHRGLIRTVRRYW